MATTIGEGGNTIETDEDEAVETPTEPEPTPGNSNPGYPFGQ